MQVRAPERDKFFCLYYDFNNEQRKKEIKFSTTTDSVDLSLPVDLIQWDSSSGTCQISNSYLERFKTRLRFAIKFVLNKIADFLSSGCCCCCCCCCFASMLKQFFHVIIILTLAIASLSALLVDHPKGSCALRPKK